MQHPECFHLKKGIWLDSPPGEGEMVVFGGQGPAPWRAPHQPQIKPQPQAQPPHQSGWPGRTTSVSGNNCFCKDVFHSLLCTGYRRPCRQSSMSRPSPLWQFGWVLSAVVWFSQDKNVNFGRILFTTIVYWMLYVGNWHLLSSWRILTHNLPLQSICLCFWAFSWKLCVWMQAKCIVGILQGKRFVRSLDIAFLLTFSGEHLG